MPPGFLGFLKLLGYLWASPITLVGLVLAGLVLLSRGSVQRVAGVLEVSGGILGPSLGPVGGRRLEIYAITLGHVVLGGSRANLEKTRRHERVHVRQYEKLGPLFPLLYFGSSALAWARGKDPYFENIFEREAFREESGNPSGV